MGAPKVSVVMPAYNAERTIKAAIESLQSQTMSDFELIVIDDASTDRTARVVQEIDDHRIRYLHNDNNLRVAESLNRGLDESRSKYVARMDADDLCLPRRLEKQLDLLERRPDISICGTYAELFGERKGQITHPLDSNVIKCELMFDTTFAHPTVMFRLDDFNEHGLRYAPLLHFEDLDLWQRALGPLNGANIPEILLKYRVNAAGAHLAGDPVEQAAQYRDLDRRTLRRLGFAPTDDELSAHHAVRRITEQRFVLDEIEQWLIALGNANRTCKVYPEEELKLYFAQLWYMACHYTPGFGPVKYGRMIRSPLYAQDAVTPALTARFLVRHRQSAGPGD